MDGLLGGGEDMLMDYWGGGAKGILLPLKLLGDLAPLLIAGCPPT